jgi:tripartite-type tricarboxylate transporter receptor subunit TctC
VENLVKEMAMVQKLSRAQALLLVAAIGVVPLSAAQQYPSQPIRAVVGYAAGGGADGMIRAISNELSEALGQPVIIDYRPGGGTVIATKIVADSKPDYEYRECQAKAGALLAAAREAGRIALEPGFGQ